DSSGKPAGRVKRGKQQHLGMRESWWQVWKRMGGTQKRGGKAKGDAAGRKKVRRRENEGGQTEDENRLCLNNPMSSD
ncbi:unnamed protein product, partial [Tetraodon nigroviridis]